MARVASKPFISGIETSIRISFGFIAAVHLDGGTAIAGDAVGQAEAVQDLR